MLILDLQELKSVEHLEVKRKLEEEGKPAQIHGNNI
jgi:hypothetical protein